MFCSRSSPWFLATQVVQGMGSLLRHGPRVPSVTWWATGRWSEPPLPQHILQAGQVVDGRFCGWVGVPAPPLGALPGHRRWTAQSLCPPLLGVLTRVTCEIPGSFHGTRFPHCTPSSPGVPTCTYLSHGLSLCPSLLHLIFSVPPSSPENLFYPPFP